MLPDDEALHPDELRSYERTAADWIACRRELEVALGIREAPELDPNAPPLVYGYIRVSGGSPSKVRYFQQGLRQYAHAHGYELANIFTDRRTASSVVTRPGFSALLDAIAVPRPVVVLVPSPSHLSWNVALCRDFQQWIVERAARLVFVRGERTGSAPGGAITDRAVGLLPLATQQDRQ